MKDVYISRRRRLLDGEHPTEVGTKLGSVLYLSRTANGGVSSDANAEEG